MHSVNMDRALLLLQLLLMTVFVAGQEQDVPCLTTRANCSGDVGFSSLTVINNSYYCCLAGYGMHWYNNQCSCRQISQGVACDVGPVACRNAGSITSDGFGNTRCCQPGFTMQSFASFFNGQSINSCTCFRGFGNGGVQVFSGNGQVFNGTDFAQRMNEWSQRLNNRLQAMTQSLNQYFGNLFRNFGF